MGINPNIRFKISESGYYYLDFIPEQQIEHYLERLSNYTADWKVSSYQLRDDRLRLRYGKIVFKINFLRIEDLLLDKLINAYGLIDKRKFSLPIPESITYFRTPSLFFIAHVKRREHVLSVKKYLGQHETVEYLCMYPTEGAIFRIWNTPQIIELEITTHIQAVRLKNHNWNEEIELLKVQKMIEKYDLEKTQYKTDKSVFGLFRVSRDKGFG